MCGRYYVDDETSREILKIVKELDKKFDNAQIKTGEIFPTNDVPILVAKNNEIEPDIFKWGFPNFSNKSVIINARSETVFEKKMFRESIVSRRCIVPASGFYEWNKSKEKISFSRPGSSIMFMAGIYNIYSTEPRFVILTTNANSSISDVHDRMPLILNNDQINDWLNDGQRTQFFLSQVPCLLNRKSDYEQIGLDLT